MRFHPTKRVLVLFGITSVSFVLLLIFLIHVEKIRGTCANAMQGPLVITSGGEVPVSGPEWSSKQLGKTATVIGLVYKTDDVPVFLSVPGAPIQHGVPCSSPEEMEQRKWRTVIHPLWVRIDDP